jgi:hypothetical protein
MPITITGDMLREYAQVKRYHIAYEETVQMYERLKVHANGEVPEHIICERRPSESEYIMEYRKKIYEPVTKASISKVISSLSKIRRSPDWSIKFEGDKVPRIAKGEELETYLMKRFPYGFTSLTNWLFSVALKETLLDANAVIMVAPINKEKEVTDYYKPFPFIFNSPRVLEFIAEDYAVLLSERCCDYDIYDSRGSFQRKVTTGAIIYYVDATRIVTYHQADANFEFQIEEDFKHGLGFMPAFKTPGIFFRACDYTFINESRISGMLPDLNEAARIYSDLQAEIVQHVHSEKWLYMNTECGTCKGTGQEIVGENTCECRSCKGIGRVPTSPYTNHVLTPPKIGEENTPTPPAGYIQKTDVAEMCQKLYDMYKSHLYDALASINMQFLDTTPLSQSGAAKEVDKDELNNFVHSEAEDLVKIMDQVVYIINEYRYNVTVSDQEKREAMLPMIAVPEKFDLLSSATMVDEIALAKQNSLNNLIISTLETEYAAKKFYNMPEVAQLLILVFQLDPMPAMTDEDKILRLQNDGVSQVDYIISSNIVPFIKRATLENQEFVRKPYRDQLSTLYQYATEKQNQNSASGQVRNLLAEDIIEGDNN